MASKDTNGEGAGQAAAAAAAPKRQREEEEEAAALRAVENMSVALDNISAQLDPLFAVPWNTLVSRCVLLPLDGQGNAPLPHGHATCVHARCAAHSLMRSQRRFHCVGRVGIIVHVLGSPPP